MISPLAEAGGCYFPFKVSNGQINMQDLGEGLDEEREGEGGNERERERGGERERRGEKRDGGGGGGGGKRDSFGVLHCTDPSKLIRETNRPLGY